MNPDFRQPLAAAERKIPRDEIALDGTWKRCGLRERVGGDEDRHEKGGKQTIHTPLYPQALKPSSPQALRASGPQRRVNVSSIVMMTGTGSPWRMPGRKRHCLAALMAS